MIRVGIGGWNFPAWRGTFYPKGHPQAKELDYASRVLTSIEINGTFYRTPPAASFKKWASEVPDGFVFSVKGPMSVVGKGVLAEAGPALEKFFASGVLEMGQKLGAARPARPSELSELADFDSQRLRVVEHQRIQGLALRAHRDVALDVFVTPT